VLGRPSDEEALRMVIAFYCVMEPEKRAQLIKLAETFARESQVVEGCTHFLMLDRASRIDHAAGDPVPVGESKES
jgi:glutamate racemase